MIPPHRLLRCLEPADLERIHQDSLKVLAEVGVVFDADEIVEMFKRRGAKVDQRRVYLTEAMVRGALETCPRRFTMVGRTAEASISIGHHQERMVVSPGNGTLYIQEISGERRKAVLSDFDQITRLCEQSRHVHLVGSLPVEPIDIPQAARPARLVHHLMRHSRKPLLGVAATREEAEAVFDIIEIAFGCSGFLDDHVAIAYSVNPASPLCFEALSCATLAAYARRNQAVFVLPGILAGISGPLDLTGLVTLSNAEILAALVCVQLIRPGAPVVYCPGTFMVNMKNVYTVTASPLSNLVNMAGLQLARHYYDLPCRTMGGMTDAKMVDFQAGAESMQNLVLYTMAGANIISQCRGVMDSLTVTSFEKWVLDEELLGRIACLERQFDQLVSEDPAAAIAAVGISGSYLTQPTTMHNCRNIWMPTLSNWDPHDAWCRNGRPPILERAHHLFLERMENCETPVLPRDIDRDIRKYIDR